MLSRDEKRDHRRMGIDCPMTFRVVDSGAVHQAIARDLSATGMLIECATEIPVGTVLEVNVAPPESIVAPLEAVVEVLRSESPQPGTFELGAAIREFRR